MPIKKSLVEAFYFEVWNKQNFQKAKEILEEDFLFRGSLGDSKKGVDGFWNYVESVHHALSHYECIIEELVISDDEVAAKMLFRGVHKNEFLGIGPTNKMIQWNGAAFCKFSKDKISELWVLGDIDSIKTQLSS